MFSTQTVQHATLAEAAEYQQLAHEIELEQAKKIRHAQATHRTETMARMKIQLAKLLADANAPESLVDVSAADTKTEKDTTKKADVELRDEVFELRERLCTLEQNFCVLQTHIVKSSENTTELAQVMKHLSLSMKKVGGLL
ncbi:MAG: hypothetical protein Faunusvirus45_3 [Faunusvirus sp.]|jgi:hypothetical protein|uniref:Uncharacterized protein n=1 Tax=Faunusvirus sp. TaxID=2487766 RepID=A0A3G5A1K5_9VIRU|nr:MAG: hypothetical protein Faunusvirus45_3 [Faunusvirus sp.]